MKAGMDILKELEEFYMLEKLAKSIEEINVLAEHYRTCHNVAAIESFAKEHSISKEDMDAFIAGKRKFLLKVLLTRQSARHTQPVRGTARPAPT